MMRRMSFKEFWHLRSLRRSAKALLQHGKSVWNMRRDLLAEGERAELRASLDTLAKARRTRDAAALEEAIEEAGAAISGAAPARPLPALRETVETLVVALGCAMTFRAFFYQPFKIPTGSMQPTLFGHHSEYCETPTLFDKMPFKPLKWLVTGKWYCEVVAPATGTVSLGVDRDRAPGYIFVKVAGSSFRIPQDAYERGEIRVPDHPDFGLADAGGVMSHESRSRVARRGDRLWSGYSIAGDHVFVNRMRWYFFPPRRGEIVVFSTDGKEHLQGGQFYIKRLAGLPGETISFDAPYLVVDGQRVTEPAAVRRVEECGEAETPGYRYPGYRYAPQREFISAGTGRPAIAPLGAPGAELPLGPDDFLPLGDNQPNSYDARYWGPVDRRHLIGTGACVYWPLSVRWGSVE